MIQNSEGTRQLLKEGRYIFRRLLWIGAMNRATGAVAERGWWNGVGTVGLQVIDRFGNISTRPYIGTGELVGIGNVPRVAGFSAQSVTVTLAIGSSSVDEALREWNPKFAPVEIHRAILDPETGMQTQPAVRRFVGFVDNYRGVEPSSGEEGSITLDCASLSQELQRSNSEMRSDVSQRKRGGDRFYRNAQQIHNLKVPWGDQDER